ncbi:MAG TPA: DUF507 family protein [Candidatus Acidoferrales bacterium]|nr:DUF507 family protein [Candidatus Acidoferrales bacterium]
MRPEQIERLAELIVHELLKTKLLVLKADLAAAKSKIKDIIQKNFAEEQQIEEEARNLVAASKGAMKDIDEHRMFVLVKQKLAQQRGFVL